MSLSTDVIAQQADTLWTCLMLLAALLMPIESPVTSSVHELVVWPLAQSLALVPSIGASQV
jgi:hypothetical protein